MSAFASIKQGLEEAAAHARGAPSGVLEHRPHAVDVAELRRRLGLTQDQFAGRFGFSVATLRHWERGDRTPQGAALVLLNVIERNPAAVLMPCGRNRIAPDQRRPGLGQLRNAGTFTA